MAYLRFFFNLFIQSILIFLPCFLFRKIIEINAILHICVYLEFGDSASHSQFIFRADVIGTGSSFLPRQILS